MASQRTRESRSTARDAPGVSAAIGRLAVRVRLLRAARGLTQEKAAERGKLDVKHWQDVEGARTNPTLATLVGVARSLGVSLSELFDEAPVADGDRYTKWPVRKRAPKAG